MKYYTIRDGVYFHTQSVNGKPSCAEKDRKTKGIQDFEETLFSDIDKKK